MIPIYKKCVGTVCENVVCLLTGFLSLTPHVTPHFKVANTVATTISVNIHVRSITNNSYLVFIDCHSFPVCAKEGRLGDKK